MVYLPAPDEPSVYNENLIYYWNNLFLQLNRLTHSISVRGPNLGPTYSSRVLGIFHLAIHDAYFAIQTGHGYATYLTPASQHPADPSLTLPPVPHRATDVRNSVAGAALTAAEHLYQQSPEFSLEGFIKLSGLIHDARIGFSGLDNASPSYRYGVDVAKAIIKLLALQPGDKAATQEGFKPIQGEYKFFDEPTNPVRLVPVDPNNPNGPQRAFREYHAPFYGRYAKRFSVQNTDHLIADPPIRGDVQPGGFDEYDDAFDDIVRMGGRTELNTTKRTPAQTAGGVFWAYDGSNLLGTPPRFYNLILRNVAWSQQRENDSEDQRNAEFVRLFTLVNVAMSDAGIFAWQEKYHFNFWRPLSGIREDTTSRADPFFLTFGAPDTNTDNIQFKPPFPAYPSGHATFAAAAFQIMRLYYRQRDNLSFLIDGPDNISFKQISEELNGVSRDLRQPFNVYTPITDQPGDVRTRVELSFSCLWEAIFSNAVSRIWLGVHWRYDGFAAEDVLIPNRTGTGYLVDPKTGATLYKDPKEISYKTCGKRSDRVGYFPIGGVPLGIGIANDIFESGMKPTPPENQPAQP